MPSSGAASRIEMVGESGMVMMHLICRESRIQFEILLSEQELPYLLPRVKNIAYSAVMAEQDWAIELAHGVADEVRRLRKDRGLSVAKLADRTEELGYPIGASVLTNFEAKRRGSRLDVSELLVLAAALDVAPLMLLFPGFPDGKVRPLPNYAPGDSRSAIQWASGRGQAFEVEGPDGLRLESTINRDGIQELADERERLVRGLLFNLPHGEVDDPAVRELIADSGREKKRLEQRIRELGGLIDGVEE